MASTDGLGFLMTRYHRAAVNGHGRNLTMRLSSTKKCFSHIASYSDKTIPLPRTSIVSHKDGIRARTNLQTQCLKFSAVDAGTQMEHYRSSKKLKPRILWVFIAPVLTSLSWVSGFWKFRDSCRVVVPILWRHSGMTGGSLFSGGPYGYVA